MRLLAGFWQALTVVSVTDKAVTAQRERNAALRHEYTLVEQLIAEAAAGGLTRNERRLRRRLERIASEFVASNVGLAGRVASEFSKFNRSSNHDADDYHSAAMLGLWEAFLLWDPSKSTFGTFSRLYMEGHTRRAVRANEAPEISYGDFSARPAVRAAVAAVERAGGDPTDFAAVAAEAGMTVAKVERILAPRPASLDKEMFSGEGETLASTIVDVDRCDVDVDVEARISDPAVTACLTPLELWVTIRNGGFDGAPPQTLSAIGSQVGKGRQTISRASISARSKLSS